ncbi:Tetratricopeptide repeat protein 27 [Amphibalanus amphitrite]|uniref:Tetratricopeptide repeat protein 27 n=1 Tax=Amphibalanus amphitrite TaxID=1232801 RepID=A0A6A4VWA0_AMPAM|nr:Tetratricopeptide repeat protein 27 [Amphibalanus amphitrite]
MYGDQEKELLWIRHADSSGAGCDSGSSAFNQVLNGNFIEALKSGDIWRVLSLDSEELWTSWDLEAIAAHISASLDGNSNNASDSLLLSGVAALCLFAQANWTGPPVEEEGVSVLGSTKDEHRTRCMAHLAVDACDIHQMTRWPQALAIARVVFEGCQHLLSSLPGWSSVGPQVSKHRVGAHGERGSRVQLHIHRAAV